MLSRGYFIGEIVDHLSDFSQQVRLRNQLGLADMSKYAEDYFRDFLNALFDYRLLSLNKPEPNVPALDLGDKGKRIGIQVTARSDVAKIRKTLENLTAEQKAVYDKFYVLVLGKKQGSYTLTDQIFTHYSFTESNVWDMSTLAREVVDLEIGPLQKLFELVRQESARVRIDMEVPDESGKYPTSAYDQWEQVVKPKLTKGEAFIAHQKDEHDVDMTDAECKKIEEMLGEMAKQLSQLPRMTREFLAMLCERCDPKSVRYFGSGGRLNIPLGSIKRTYRGEDFDGEISLLTYAGIVDIEPHHKDPEIPIVSISFPGVTSDLYDGFLEYVQSKGLNMRKVLGEVDLSGF
jgi:hypothetical protein